MRLFAGFALLLEGMVAAKLWYDSDGVWASARLVAPACFLTALLVSVIEPQLTATWLVFMRSLDVL